MAGLLALSVIVAFAAVVFRYLLDSALSWSFEVSLILLTYITFVGCYAALRRGAHLKVDVLAQRLPRPLHLAVFLLAQVTVLGVCVIMVVWGSEQMLKFAGETTTLLGVPRGPIYAIVPLSGLAMGLDTLARSLRGLRRYARGARPEGAEDSFSLDM